MQIVTRLLTAVFIICLSFTGHTQDSTSIFGRSINLPDKFIGFINKKTARLDNELTKQTEKYLQRLQKREQKLKKKLYRLDSNATKNLFLLNTDQQYLSFQQKMHGDSLSSHQNISGEYMAHTDTVQTSLSFLKQNPQLLNGSAILPADVQNSMAKLQQLQAKMQDADQLKQYVRQRKEQIKQYLLQFAHLPPGITSIYNDYNKELYYYNAQLQEYKETLNNPDKLIEKVVGVLNRLSFFQNFMKNNSMLASLLPSGNGAGTMQAIAGLQTRDQVAQMVGAQLSSAGAQAAASGSISDAQSQLNQLKDRVMNYGSGGADVDVPNFKPNTQKTKTFFSRLEYGTNIQTQNANYFFPATTDLGLSIGYKLNDKGNSVGIGGSYKMSLGNGVNHINISGQGAGIRTYTDIKIKSSFYFSGGLEYNYQQPIKLIDFPSLKSWDKSGLIGLSKIISVKTKVFKKTKVQLLWDFLSYQQVPKTQPFKFRIGYNF